MNSSIQGVVFAVSAYSLWAVAPIYFKALGHVGAIEILAHRVIWSLLLTGLIIVVIGQGQKIRAVLKTPITLAGLALSTCLIAINWGLFIWLVTNNQLLSASLGYYINPLVSIVLGMFFFNEKLGRVRLIAASLCLLAVIFEFIQFGRIPIIALGLALSFGVYGLIRKKLGVDSFTGMLVETGALFPFALGYLFWLNSTSHSVITDSSLTNFLLLMAGPVTMVPLLCFAAAANRISLMALGFFQYIGPSGMFLLAVFVFGETFVPAKLVTFGLIWCALGLLSWDSARKFIRLQRTPSSKLETSSAP
ncbi:MAG: chloramphenicol-sensitive protein RarD [Lentisphaeria bacterium]